MIMKILHIYNVSVSQLFDEKIAAKYEKYLHGKMSLNFEIPELAFHDPHNGLTQRSEWLTDMSSAILFWTPIWQHGLCAVTGNHLLAKWEKVKLDVKSLKGCNAWERVLAWEREQLPFKQKMPHMHFHNHMTGKDLQLKHDLMDLILTIEDRGGVMLR